MAQLIRDFDWAATPLGPSADWPIELKTIVNFILESQFPAAIVWGADFTTIYNDAFRPILGHKPEALGRSFADIWSEAWDEIAPIARRAYRGEATFIRDFPLKVDRTGRVEQAWFTFCYSPLRLADGSVAGMMDTVVETTATVQAQRDLEVLNNELRHRLKNNLATVQSLARQTLKSVPDRCAVENLLDRIVALGAAHDVLFRHGWSSATVQEVARASLSGLLPLQRIALAGPHVPIDARATVALALVLHELATNAAKYGSLSSHDGRVSLIWTVDGVAGLLRLDWAETGGPPASPPERTGFGSQLIDRGLSPRSRVSRTYSKSGFRAEITTPLDDLLAE